MNPNISSSTTVVSSKGHKSSSYGYAPQYPLIPFTEFETVDADTPLESLNLNWREQDLPERIRTKHVHRLHPYLGKYVPQLVEIFLRKFQPSTVCDPFAGSGTTLVEASTLGIDAIGCDISEFNCLISSVKTAVYDLDLLDADVTDILSKALSPDQPRLVETAASYCPSSYLNEWFAPPALQSLLAYQALIDDYTYSDVLRLILSRAARSARRVTHFDLDFPKKPQIEPYHCYKHSRICRPTEDSAQFLKRYSTDTLKRIRAYSAIRKESDVTVITGDSSVVDFPEHDLVVTSPPYVGLIDYHEQHRYAYELLGLPWRADSEIGSASNGSSKRARTEYVEGMSESFLNVKRSLAESGRMVVVVNDKLGLYDEICQNVGMKQETRLERHVNRRTGRRSGDFFESVLVWLPK